MFIDNFFLWEIVFEIKDKENPPAVRWDKFVSLAATMNFKDEDQLLRATRFLNDLGSLVFFEDEKSNDRLIVLDPQWLTAMFASVITTSHNYIKNGILKRINIGQIWRAPQYPASMHLSLISLLQKFEILYELPEYDGEECFLIPNLLPEDKPPIDLLWIQYEPNVLQFSKIYTLDFVPNGFFAKFMVRFLHYTDKPLKFWRTGIIGVRQGSRALIELIETSVHITIRGETAAEYLRIACEIVDILATNFFKVQIAKAVVPCPHCVALKSENPYYFDLIECEQAAARLNIRVLPCKVDDTQIRLDRIVPDIAMTDFEGSQVNFSEIEIGKSVGKGAFGEIFKGTWKNEFVAVKRLKVEDEKMAVSAFSEFRREVWLMSGLHHPCIVNLKAYSTSPLSMIMEFVTGGDLYNFIHNPNIDIDWDIRLKIALDMANGMAFLHGISPPLLHRDLKSPNVLIVDHKDHTPVIAKVADFGLSSRLFVDTLTDRAVENPTWCAPEVLENKPYTVKADVYSYGMMLWELYTRELPFDNYKFQYQVEDDVKKGVRPSIPEDCWEEYKELIQVCWHPIAEKRPLFDKIIKAILSMISTKIGNDKFRFPIDSTTLATLEMNKQSANQKKQIIVANQLQGTVTKKVHVECNKNISCLIPVMNQVWCATLDGIISIFSAESGRFLTSYQSQQNEVFTLRMVNNHVWSGCSHGVIASWVVEDLVTVESYDVRVRSNLLMIKPDKKRFSSKKPVSYTCSLFKSGFLRIFKSVCCLFLISFCFYATIIIWIFFLSYPLPISYFLCSFLLPFLPSAFSFLHYNPSS